MANNFKQYVTILLFHKKIYYLSKIFLKLKEIDDFYEQCIRLRFFFFNIESEKRNISYIIWLISARLFSYFQVRVREGTADSGYKVYINAFVFITNPTVFTCLL